MGYYMNKYENYEEYADREGIVKACKWCKTEFTPASPWQKYCKQEYNPACESDRYYQKLWDKGKHPLQKLGIGNLKY